MVAATEATPGLGAGRAGGAVASTLGRLLGDAEHQGYAVRLGGCGVVVPGVVDDAKGAAVWSANLGWRDVEVVGPLEGRVGLPVALGHGVPGRPAGRGRVGAARGVDNVLFVPLGTGIAEALIVDSRVLQGGGYAGELGHVGWSRRGRSADAGPAGAWRP